MKGDVTVPTDADLRAEQAYHDEARAQLARMRERTRSLDLQTGDAVAAERLAITLWQRARALEDDGRSALYFGRIEVDADHPAAQGRPTGWHVGRRHIGDEAGDPVVIDWRADVSTAYYRASHTDPMHVTLRRRFGFDQGTISAIEDEHLQDTAESPLYSQILAGEIERPRVGPMRDIVSTIQPEQDALVRVDDTTTVCIQGAPGTGKTAVGLHRAAWLLFTYRARLARRGVLVIGPNRAFLEHISAVLPTLGEVDVRHATADDLVSVDATPPVRVRADDHVEVATLKGDARMAAVLRRAVWAHVARPQEALQVPRGTRVWRVPAYEVADELDTLLARDLPYEVGRAHLAQRLAHLVMLRMEAAGDFPSERTQDTLARSAPIKAYAKALWPQLKPATVLHGLFSDADVLAVAAGDDLTVDEQRMLLWHKAPAGPGSARWTAADAVLLDEIGHLIERVEGFGHVVLDEAQDLSPMQLRAVGRRCATGAATVLGDLAQGTTPWATRSWAETLTHLGHPDGRVEELRRGYRVPASVIDYASRLLPAMAPGLTPPEPVRANAGVLDVRAVNDVWAALVPTVADALRAPGSVGVIVPAADVSRASAVLAAVGIEHRVLGADQGDVEHRVDVVPATVAKGLEFDSVVVADLAGIAAAEPDERTGLRRLYVVLTRAVSQLFVLHHGDEPAALRA